MDSRAKVRIHSARDIGYPLEGLRPSWRADNVERGLARLRSNNRQNDYADGIATTPPRRTDRVAPFMSSPANTKLRKA
jgi:hypothetical protein